MDFDSAKDQLPAFRHTQIAFRFFTPDSYRDGTWRNGKRKGRVVTPPYYSFFKRIFLYSTFMGGPTCTCTPNQPEKLRLTVSLSITSLIKIPLT